MPDETIQTFEEAAAQVRRLAQGMDYFVSEREPMWSPDSPAEAECAQHTFRDSWGDQPVQAALLLNHVFLVHMQDHLLALAALFETPEVLLAPMSLTRPILTAAATSFYLLEPGIDVRERLRRGTNVQLASYVERTNMAPTKAGEDYAHYAGRVLAIRASAGRHGYVVNRARNRRGGVHLQPQWLGDRPPSEMALVHALLGDVEGGPGRLLYRMSSAFVHGQPHAVVMMLHPQATDSPLRAGVGMARLGASVAQMATWSVGTIYGVHLAMERMCMHLGWEAERWHGPAISVLRQWRATMLSSG